MTRFWFIKPPDSIPVHVQLGARLGLAFSESIPSKVAEAWASPYVLIRPELHWFLDIETPFGESRAHTWVIRLAVDTPVSMAGNIKDIFRWTVGLGMAWGLGDG